MGQFEILTIFFQYFGLCPLNALKLSWWWHDRLSLFGLVDRAVFVWIVVGCIVSPAVAGCDHVGKKDFTESSMVLTLKDIPIAEFTKKVHNCRSTSHGVTVNLNPYSGTGVGSEILALIGHDDANARPRTQGMVDRSEFLSRREGDTINAPLQVDTRGLPGIGKYMVDGSLRTNLEDEIVRFYKTHPSPLVQSRSGDAGVQSLLSLGETGPKRGVGVTLDRIERFCERIPVFLETRGESDVPLFKSRFHSVFRIGATICNGVCNLSDLSVLVSYLFDKESDVDERQQNNNRSKDGVQLIRQRSFVPLMPKFHPAAVFGLVLGLVLGFGGCFYLMLVLCFTDFTNTRMLIGGLTNAVLILCLAAILFHEGLGNIISHRGGDAETWHSRPVAQ